MYSSDIDRPTQKLSMEKKPLRKRRCFVSNQSHSTCKLVRFVVAPDNSIVPDLAERLPGRGFWLLSSREVVNTACSNGLFAKVTGSNVTVRDNLADHVEIQLSQRCLNWLGMARRAGDAVGGFEKVVSFLEANVGSIVFCASDASDGGRRKVLSGAKEAFVVNIFSGAELGSMFGRKRMVYVAVRQKLLASRIITESTRLAGFRISGTF